jgi:hypothetical protein
MKRAVAGIAVIILTLAGPAMAGEQSSATASTSSSQAVEIGSALTVTATETITTIGLVVTITRTQVGSGPVGTHQPRSFEIN